MIVYGRAGMEYPGTRVPASPREIRESESR